MRKILKNLKETGVFAEELLGKLSKSDKNEATLVLLFGELGAGKTALVKLVAKNLGIKEHITSPTFVIIKNYKLPKKTQTKFKTLIHIDAYRLNKGKELLDLNWSEIISNKENIIFLEWPERVKEILPKESVKIYLEVVGKDKRLVKVI